MPASSRLERELYKSRGIYSTLMFTEQQFFRLSPRVLSTLHRGFRDPSSLGRKTGAFFTFVPGNEGFDSVVQQQGFLQENEVPTVQYG